MQSVIAIVGRPNVGKSTLFNRLTQTRNALVADRPGVTRDRQVGTGQYKDSRFYLVDTGGIGEINPDHEAITRMVEQQAIQAVAEADAVIWLVDGRSGLNAIDEELAEKLRTQHGNIHLAVNKTDGLDKDLVLSDFYALGMGDPVAISSQRGDGIETLMDHVIATLPPAAAEAEVESMEGLKISVLGRPNVGKSTLINRILGEERLLTFDHPGTTRDSIAIPFERDDQKYILIDTAGVRRRARVKDHVEKYSVIKSLQAIDAADIVIMVLDAHEDITEQDLNLLGTCYEQGKAQILAVNKWDGIEPSQRERIRAQLERKITFLQQPYIHFISALHGSGVGNLFKSINAIAARLNLSPSTSDLSDLLALAVQAHPPPMVRGRRIKMRYAHMGGHNPFRIIVHGNQVQETPASYTRYLSNYFQKQLRLKGIPVLIEYKKGENPYAGRRNKLTKRQIEKKKRLMKFVKKGK